MKKMLWPAMMTGLVLVLSVTSCRKKDNCADVNPNCRYDLNALKKTDTNLLIKAGVSYIKPAMSNLTALAVDGADSIIVGSRTGIEIIGTNGTRLSRFTVGMPVSCLAAATGADEDFVPLNGPGWDGRFRTRLLGGDVFVGQKDHIEVYGQDGTRKAVWKSPDPKTELTSIAVSRQFVYAADCVNRIVWRFSIAGVLLGRVGAKDNDRRKNGFVVPSAFFDVAVSRDGSLLAANPGEHRIEHFTADGTFMASWGRASLEADGFCGCCNPSNFAIMPDGSFVTSEKHIVRVKIYDAAGGFKGIISGQEEWPKEAIGLDLAVDSRGRIFVLDPQADVVRVYTRK